ncbi:MAG: hypothetical protein RL199_525 [Pseudomonadota bacterium]|jgi:hypothetical protein
MIERLLLVAWKGSQSVGWAETFRSSGYTVLVEETTGERAWRTAKERGIDCVVIDGEKKPSLGRQTGYQLRDTAKTRGIPIVWANLNPDEASLVQSDVRPDVTLPRPTDPSEVLAAIVTLDLAREADRLAAEPPVEAPVVVTSPTSAEPPPARAVTGPAGRSTAAKKMPGAKPAASKTVPAKPRGAAGPAKRPVASKAKPAAVGKRVASAKTERKPAETKTRRPSSARKPSR